MGGQLSGCDRSLKLGIVFLRKKTSPSYIKGDVHNLKTPHLDNITVLTLIRQEATLQTVGFSDDLRLHLLSMLTCPLVPGRP